jgi:hypothetical protein
VSKEEATFAFSKQLEPKDHPGVTIVSELTRPWIQALKLLLIESGCVKLTHLNPNGSEVILALRGAKEAPDLPSRLTFRNHTWHR